MKYLQRFIESRWPLRDTVFKTRTTRSSDVPKVSPRNEAGVRDGNRRRTLSVAGHVPAGSAFPAPRLPLPSDRCVVLFLVSPNLDLLYFCAAFV